MLSRRSFLLSTAALTVATPVAASAAKDFWEAPLQHRKVYEQRPVDFWMEYVCDFELTSWQRHVLQLIDDCLRSDTRLVIDFPRRERRFARDMARHGMLDDVEWTARGEYLTWQIDDEQ